MPQRPSEAQGGLLKHGGRLHVTSSCFRRPLQHPKLSLNMEEAGDYVETIHFQEPHGPFVAFVGHWRLGTAVFSFKKGNVFYKRLLLGQLLGFLWDTLSLCLFYGSSARFYFCIVWFFLKCPQCQILNAQKMQGGGKETQLSCNWERVRVCKGM